MRLKHQCVRALSSPINVCLCDTAYLLILPLGKRLHWRHVDFKISDFAITINHSIINSKRSQHSAFANMQSDEAPRSTPSPGEAILGKDSAQSLPPPAEVAAVGTAETEQLKTQDEAPGSQHEDERSNKEARDQSIKRMFPANGTNR